VLVGQVPGIFYRFGDFYASAAALGALAYYLVFAVDPRLALVVAVIVTLVVRVGSRALKLRLPVPRSGGGEPPPGSPRR